MRFNCPDCDWSIEGQTQVVEDILAHEKTHRVEEK